MNLLSRRAAEYGIGKRPLNESDFYAFCERHDIQVIWTTSRYSCYMNIDGHDVIMLSTRLSGWLLLWTMWHEVGHYILHVGELLGKQAANCRNEREAELIAKMAIYGKRGIFYKIKPFIRQMNAFVDEL